MNKKLIIGVILGLAVISAFVAIIVSRPSDTAASVAISEGYFATTTDQWVPTATGQYRLIKSGYGQLGSVVITTQTAGVINLYDGTSTINGASQQYYSTTTLAKIGASAPAGTYTLDISFKKGLLIEVQGTNLASTTITYK